MQVVEKNQNLFERAKKVIPGGVNSPVRSFSSVGGVPYFVRNAEGPYVWDEEGNRYIDYVQSYGPMILGHSHPAVIEAINKAASCGTSYGAPTKKEIVLAESITPQPSAWGDNFSGSWPKGGCPHSN